MGLCPRELMRRGFLVGFARHVKTDGVGLVDLAGDVPVESERGCAAEPAERRQLAAGRRLRPLE